MRTTTRSQASARSLASLNLAALRDALLPKLFTGELSVSEAKRLVEDNT